MSLEQLSAAFRATGALNKKGKVVPLRRLTPANQLATLRLFSTRRTLVVPYGGSMDAGAIGVCHRLIDLAETDDEVSERRSNRQPRRDGTVRQPAAEAIV